MDFGTARLCPPSYLLQEDGVIAHGDWPAIRLPVTDFYIIEGGQEEVHAGPSLPL